MKEWIEELKRNWRPSGEDWAWANSNQDLLNLIAEIERLEAALAELTETHNDLLRCRDDQLPEILRENKRLEADIESRNNERIELAHGIKKMQVALAEQQAVMEKAEAVVKNAWLGEYSDELKVDKPVLEKLRLALSALAEGKGKEKK